MSDLEARIAEVLKAHLKRNIKSCDCGWSEIGKAHYNHLAAMLAPVIREAQAEALREAADLLAPKGILWWGDSGVRVSDGPFGMPQGSLDDWLRARADNLEAPNASNP